MPRCGQAALSARPLARQTRCIETPAGRAVPGAFHRCHLSPGYRTLEPLFAGSPIRAVRRLCLVRRDGGADAARDGAPRTGCRSEEHTSELQSLMRTSYAVFCLKKKTRIQTPTKMTTPHTSRLLSKT